MKKRIAIVVPNLAGSGGEKIALSQAKMFHENGNDVVLFLLEDVKLYDSNNIAFPIVMLTNKKNKFKLFGIFGYKYYAKILKSKMELFGTFDLVLSNLPRADRVVKELTHSNKYFVIHMSYKAELKLFSRRRASKKLKLYRYLYNDEHLITITNAMQMDFNDLDIYPKSMKTIYNPFDFNAISNKGKDKIEYKFDYIISPSAFRIQKRYDVMLDAFKLLEDKDIKLLILTQDNLELKNMIRERDLDNRVVVAGFKQNPYKYINNAKLLVLSSDREGLPTVVIESLILNTPVVSTDCPTGPKEIMIGELSKWLVPMDNPQMLSERIDEALTSDIIIEKKLLDKFNENNIYKDFQKLIN